MSILHTQGEFPDNFPIRMRTLVVDDSIVLLENLCAYLNSKPFFQVVGTAANGREALRMAELNQPDLVLMDLNMPVMDGLKTTEILRRRLPNLRIIIMTQDDSAKAEAQTRAQGAHGFIYKPAIMNDGVLLNAIRRAFPPDDTEDPQGHL